MNEEVDEVLCPNNVGGQLCNFKVARWQKFCSECGAKVKDTWFKKSVESFQHELDEFKQLDGNNQICCGHEIPLTANACPNCGTLSKSIFNFFNNIFTSA